MAVEARAPCGDFNNNNKSNIVILIKIIIDQNLTLSKRLIKIKYCETVSDIQRESQAVFDSIKENYFHGAFEAWKK
jgi:hypothetical protein